MEQVTIWYQTDNDSGSKLINAIKGLGLALHVISGYNSNKTNIVEENINIFIFDFIEKEPKKIIKKIADDRKLQGCIKFLILNKKEVKEISNLSFNILHIEFISRPVNKNEFLLLLEKTIIVERYREIMKYISKEAELRIETYEGLMDINRKNVFESEKEKKAFEKIIAYEKNLMKEQTMLNTAIRDFTLLRQSEMFDMQNRIRAEEMLSDLRRKELIDARSVIQAQESVIDYSAKELDSAKKIISASETVAELSRSEAMQLHDELKRAKALNKSLSDEVDRLLKEIESLKKK